MKQDDVLMQLSSGSVCVDIKAPHSGFLDMISVSLKDRVAPGHLLAVMDMEPSAAAPRPRVHAGRVPSIHFPPRMTLDGKRISSLPVAEQLAVLAADTAQRHQLAQVPDSEPRTRPPTFMKPRTPSEVNPSGGSPTQAARSSLAQTPRA